MDSTIALSSMSMLIQKIPSAPFLGETGVSGRNESKKNIGPGKYLDGRPGIPLVLSALVQMLMQLESE